MKTRFIANATELRRYCVENNFYTMGTNEEYNDLFNLFLTINKTMWFDSMVETLEMVARDIMIHTDDENWILDSDMDDNIKEVMSGLLENGVVQIYFD